MALFPSPPNDLSPEQFFEGHLKDIDEISRSWCRRYRLSREDTEDFGQQVRLRFIENDYGKVRQFQGRSGPRTYLTIVIKNLFQDFQNSRLGKWRPSAEAQRLGGIAVLLDQLLHRKRLSLVEAFATLWIDHKVSLTDEQLSELAAKLPVHNLRLVEDEEELQNRPSREPGPEELVEAQEMKREAGRILAALEQALDLLPPEERFLVLLRTRLKVADIARAWKLEQKPLYRRLARSYRLLAEELERRGVTRQDVKEMLEFLGKR